MRKEITALAPSSTVPGVAAPADRKHSQWLGGAILSTIGKFNDMWITRKEYKMLLKKLSNNNYSSFLKKVK